MDYYPKMYTILFNAITDALALLEQGNIDKAKQTLINGQLDAEDIFIIGTEPTQSVEF